MGEWKFLLLYGVFLVVTGIFFNLDGAENFITDPSANVTIVAPTPPSPGPLDILTFIVYVIDNITFIFSLVFITPFSALGFLSFLAIAGAIVSFYIVLRLIRGGG